MPVGNEGAGVVVAAGSSDEAQALLGRTVAIIGGATYAEYRCLPAMMCLALPDGTDPADGASCFVNPLTALGMVETMKMEGHHALVHTAAASNLGQMLQRICLADGVPLVNIVRRPEQADLLRGLGATHVCNSSAPTFMDDLTSALVETGATIAFDAIGGGRQAGQILACMEAAANAKATEYSRYGSSVHKQVYIYGGLDRGPTEFIPQLRHGLGHRRLVAHPVPRQDRPGGHAPAAGSGGGRADHHLRQSLHRRGLARRCAEPRRHQGLRPSGHGPEVPHPPVAAVGGVEARHASATFFNPSSVPCQFFS